MMFKPNIEDVILRYELSGKVLMPKNSGLDMDLIDLSKYWEIDKETYSNGKIEIILARGEDIPNRVEEYFLRKGEKVLGITGDDLFDEYRIKNPKGVVSLLETIDWYDKNAMFTRPALGLLKPTNKSLEGNVRIGLNKKYEATSIKALYEIKNELNFEPIFTSYSGGTEKTVTEGLNDACVEVVYTGRSLKENSLEILKVLRLSDIALIGVNGNSYKSIKGD